MKNLAEGLDAVKSMDRKVETERASSRAKRHQFGITHRLHISPYVKEEHKVNIKKLKVGVMELNHLLRSIKQHQVILW